MAYAKVENNNITPHVSLPSSLLLENGDLLCGFNALSLNELKQYGFYELVDITPAFDNRLSYLGEPTYTVESDRITVEYELHDYSLAELKKRAITAAYAECENTLNQYSQGYSMAEIATFPAMQTEILTYLETGVVGVGMQGVINRRRHTAESLTAVLMPKITAQQTALLERDNHVSVIMSLETCLDVVNYGT